MKTLIAYASRYGTVEECVHRLEGLLGDEVTVARIDEKGKDIDPEPYERVLIGASVRAGKLQKSVINFATANLDVLKGKTVGLFLCSLTPPGEAMHYIDENFPPEVVKRAKAKGCFGGAVHFKKMNFLERFIMKKITKTDQDINNISDDSIQTFAKQLTS